MNKVQAIKHVYEGLELNGKDDAFFRGQDSRIFSRFCDLRFIACDRPSEVTRLSKDSLIEVANVGGVECNYVYVVAFSKELTIRAESKLELADFVFDVMKRKEKTLSYFSTKARPLRDKFRRLVTCINSRQCNTLSIDSLFELAKAIGAEKASQEYVVSYMRSGEKVIIN